MKPKSLEIFIPGPAGRLEAKYYKNPKFGSPVAIVLLKKGVFIFSSSNKSNIALSKFNKQLVYCDRGIY